MYNDANDVNIGLAKHAVRLYFNATVHQSDPYVLEVDQIYVVWFAKVLQNWKALLSTTVPDVMYYELTYNGDKDELYIDAYKKWNNRCIENPMETVPFTVEPVNALPTEKHDEATLRKAFDAIRGVTDNDEDATNAIHNLQNAGILFRERA